MAEAAPVAAAAEEAQVASDPEHRIGLLNSPRKLARSFCLQLAVGPSVSKNKSAAILNSICQVTDQFGGFLLNPLRTFADGALADIQRSAGLSPQLNP